MRNDQQKKYRTKSKDAIMTYLEMHNLDKLTESGVVLKYKTAEDECCRYQCAKPHAHCHEHIHMQCRSCGKILHLECEFMEEIIKHLYDHHRFTLECSGSVLMGMCEACQISLENKGVE